MENNKYYVDKINKQFITRKTISPFLFYGDNKDLLNELVYDI
jgi:hypothetical protein